MFVLAMSAVLAPEFAHAVSFRVVDRSGKALAQGEEAADLSKSVGDFTVALLTSLAAKNILSFHADASGVDSINGVGNETETVSSREEKAYGWCYKVNGKDPNKTPDEVRFTANGDTLEWYYAYADNFDGNWLGMCLTDY
jgi:hypothetical protein